MARPQFPNLPDEIMSNTIGLVGEESSLYLGAFIRAGIRGYELVHDPFILKRCNVTPIVYERPSQLGKSGNFRNFFLKCVDVGNIVAVYYEGFHRATTLGVEEGINVLERNVPTHVLSTLAVGIFNVCLGKEMEAITVFQQLARNGVDLKSEALFEIGDELETRLWSFHAPFLNTYGRTLKFPRGDFLGHSNTVHEEELCKNCWLHWLCLKISHML
ncbi:hypothetical protein F2Q69_00007660 [Brassica cretica]|uniref:Uncharacterized protein n=2 Tax=Brassica TaxID=3705 RepID=A0A8S9PBP7_BRACR|nr:hypothetical protein F2Q69_00007660 [Brassica cretica]